MSAPDDQPTLAGPSDKAQNYIQPSPSQHDAASRRYSEESALDSFRIWRRATLHNDTYLRRKAFYTLPYQQRRLLSDDAIVNLPFWFRMQDDAIKCNAAITSAIYESGLKNHPPIDPDHLIGKARDTDLDAVQQPLRLLYRDWSAAAAEERKTSHGPILEAMTRYLPSEPHRRHNYSVLVPGSGLGRLVCELVNLGFTATANEMTAHNYIAFDWLRFADLQARSYQLFPWVASNSNHISRDDQMQSFSIPDVTLAEMVGSGEQSEVPWLERLHVKHGDLGTMTQISKYNGAFDAVATCFFIDTAKNFFDYIETIKYCLKAGGVWINHGPLAWHHEHKRRCTDREADWGLFELTDEEVVKLVEACGFEVLEQRRTEDAVYQHNSRAMMSYAWRLSFWVAKKL